MNKIINIKYNINVHKREIPREMSCKLRPDITNRINTSSPLHVNIQQHSILDPFHLIV